MDSVHRAQGPEHPRVRGRAERRDERACQRRAVLSLITSSTKQFRQKSACCSTCNPSNYVHLRHRHGGADPRRGRQPERILTRRSSVRGQSGAQMCHLYAYGSDVSLASVFGNRTATSSARRSWCEIRSILPPFRPTTRRHSPPAHLYFRAEGHS